MTAILIADSLMVLFSGGLWYRLWKQDAVFHKGFIPKLICFNFAFCLLNLIMNFI